MKIRAVIFDFDGVINDSASQETGGKRIVQVVKRNGHRIPANIYGTLKSNWGLPGIEMVQKSFGLDAETAKKIYQEWERMDATEFFPLIPGLERVLKKLKSDGIKVLMLTSRNRENLMAVLDHFLLTGLFDLIQTKNDGPFIKPDPRAFYSLLVGLSESGICPRECIYIGDTIFDFKCAIAAGIRSISVLTGPFGRAEFLKIGQKKENIIRSIADLPKWIKKHKDC